MDISNFLEDLPKNTPEIITTTIHEIKTAYQQHVNSNYIIFSHIKPEIIDQLIEDEQNHMRIFYNADLRKLIAKPPKRPHEIATRSFEFLILREAGRRGLLEALTPIGSETIKDGQYVKEADAGYVPRRYIPGRDGKWPTLVVETGVSLPRLRIDAQWWLLQSSGQVRIVIIIAVNHDTPEICFERWELQYLGQLYKAQEIRMTHTENHTITVGAPLTFQFQDVFFNSPSGTFQGPFLFEASQLESIAETVWAHQGFLPLPV